MNTLALIRLWNLTQMHRGTSGARAAAGVLLGLYNGARFPFDLTELRVLDSSNLQAAIDVVNADASRCQREVHEWLNLLAGRRDFGQRFEHLAHEYAAFKRGRCKREHLVPLQPASLVLDAGEYAHEHAIATPEAVESDWGALSPDDRALFPTAPLGAC